MTRRAHGSLCHCGAATLYGDDADTCGLPARVDPYPLTRRGELLMVAAGRHAYEWEFGRLYRRDRWSIRSQAAAPVLAEHRCGDPVPTGWRLPPAPRPTPTPTTEEIPW
jgi:hypothetical protein